MIAAVGGLIIPRNRIISKKEASYPVYKYLTGTQAVQMLLIQRRSCILCRQMPDKQPYLTILVAPLDWGLGHATRCIPIVRYLIQANCKVILAAAGPHAALLQQAFPALPLLPLPGYGIRYGRGNLAWQLFRQLPRFFRSIRSEQQWLQQTIDEYRIDAVVSDNRYGLYSSKVPCVLITHQLRIQTPPLLRWAERWVQRQLYRFIEKFSECWIPDHPDPADSLGRQLSHSRYMPAVAVHYIGWLTRFLPHQQVEPVYTLLVSLSGPEPQRTLLEDQIVSQLDQVTGKILLVRGLPGSGVIKPLLPEQPAHLTIVNHLPAAALQQAIAASRFFISRCGYSTLMDLQAVAVRCIFVPTPGQTEQEYLAREMATEGKAVICHQSRIRLADLLHQASMKPVFSAGTYRNELLEKHLRNWMENLLATRNHH